MQLSAHECAVWASLAYNTPDAIRTMWQEGSLKGCIAEPIALVSDIVGMQCFLFQLNSGYIASVRGTVNIQDIVDDIDVKTTLFRAVPGAMVHAGFYAQYSILYYMLQLHLLAPTSIAFVGHSMGAAVAQLCALSMALQWKDQGHVQSVAFGCPKTGNSAFASAFQSTFPAEDRASFQFSSDPVPKMLWERPYVQAAPLTYVGPIDYFPTLPVMTRARDHHVNNYRGFDVVTSKPAPLQHTLRALGLWTGNMLLRLI
jgi:hypothetical protein